MSLYTKPSATQIQAIHAALESLARYGEANTRIRLLARQPLALSSIVFVAKAHEQQSNFIKPDHVWQLRDKVRDVRRASASMTDRMTATVATDANGMCYPKPNGGHRILPSIYTRIREWWMRANGVTVQVQDMNDGHLENTMKLLHESHGNLIARSTELLGKMANHFHRDKVIMAKLEGLCRELQKVEVDDLYPIFKEMAAEATQRKGTPPMLVAIDPDWLRSIRTGLPTATSTGVDMIIEVHDEDLPQLKILLRRALNTWDNPPKWALELADKVDTLTKENPHGTGNDGS